MIQTSPSGVRISADFRDNLIIDRYDPIFVTMRASKLKHFRSENSEDAVTWNVFRSLRQVDPAAWIPSLVSRGFPGEVLGIGRVALTSGPRSRHPRHFWIPATKVHQR